MNLVKCPRCDLNYILDTEKLCKVCLREMKGNHVEDELEMCSVCNEAPALPGHDVCLSCLKEMNGSTNDEDVEEGGTVVDESSLGLNSVSNMDEIIPQINDDEDFSDLEGDLSLESVIEDEENEENESEDEE
ncbi:MAG: hypothetical protein IKK75_09660 [Clostridia bacterium]|nr:hypothetical protein [Clostridia bacterium]